jgi:hypothetical protein
LVEYVLGGGAVRMPPGVSDLAGAKEIADGAALEHLELRLQAECSTLTEGLRWE